ncbi:MULTISPECIES: LacI family DNA-binding transcriptional regulator [Halomonadaceae]|jgi:LacI family transcriptional regulator|uniref:HTH-type transcriptional repressor PurR n=2 Tax=Oceanospirillales TaxID=135619 RepID=A0A653MM97_9GAMM|nr:MULTISPECIES: substrate-binding domain-containing protein [Halomonas]NAO96484.1 LacI family DNA-binding transcriptional regulator [Halomonas sp. MG34]PKH63627.1 LacI family transcriptional regulator [Halomonas sp. Choline-3u-9]QGQ69697.1 LacI family DNA-binding transcriptional regulator [Halomonas sp. PA16-9]CAD5271425.1 LacI family transcriptional regulator [Halomonas sp. 156]QKS22352.1 HTH-type transcriptional repressor PurR [Halomonas titanicae]
MHGKPITMQDVAKAAGVSTSTVSRVLDERLPPSNSPAAQRVKKTAEELGYKRDILASSLRRGGTGTIGVLVPRLSDTVMALIYEAISKVAQERHYFAIVATSGDDPESERQAVELLLNRRVDGLILATSRLDDQLPSQLRDRGVPHSLVLRTDGKSPSALGDDIQGGYLATRHLIDLGHRDIGLVAGPSFTSSARDRQKGFRKAMSESGIPVREPWIIESGYGIEAGEEAGLALLSQNEKPTAIFAVNDNLAIGVMAAAHRLGIEVGKTLSLVGYNDIPLASRLPVPLTSVYIPFDYIAQQAVDLLLSDKHSGSPINRVAMPSLIPRSSSVRHI